jgi:hypothetical protein
LDEWESIINGVEKTTINTRLSNAIVFIFDEEETEVNLNYLRTAGISEDDIDDLVHDAIADVADTDATIDVSFDISRIIDLVTPITQNYLKALE